MERPVVSRLLTSAPDHDDPSLCHLDRRGHGPAGPPKVMKNGFCSATTVPQSAALSFVISTEAQRSGEICGSTVPSWKCFSTHHHRNVCLLILLALLSASLSAQTQPAATIPNGRQITPVGDWISVAPFPFALAMRPDGQQLIAPSLGFPFALNVIDRPANADREVMQIPRGFLSVPGAEFYAGVAYSPSGKMLYVATGDTGAVDVISTGDWKKTARISLNGASQGHVYRESFAAALALSRNGRSLYVVDQANFRVVVINTATRTRTASLKTGVNPIALCLSPDNRRLYVANSGLFEYKTVPGADNSDRLHSGLHFPPFGYPSAAAQDGTSIEGRQIAGLGDANSVMGSSLWTYDLAGARARHVASLRLGTSIAPASHVVGGAAPSAVVANDGAVYVALAHEDTIAVISNDGRVLQTQIPLSPFTGPQFQDGEGIPLRGVMPSGLALTAGRLYVTEAGINALAVVDTTRESVLGHLPVGWSPSAVMVSPDGGTIYVANSKGKGSGPNAGSKFNPALHGAYIGELELGSISAIPTSEAEHAEAQTATVIHDNTIARLESSSLPRLKHVFLIIRENRTFDDVFGDLEGADGDPAVARYGMHGQVKGEAAMQDLHVTPNAHAMAARFSTSDHYYTDSDVSVDGHRWAIGIAPTPWMAQAWPATYGGRRHGNPFSEAPGRRALGGATDGPMPEDEPEFGSLWEHVSNAGLRVLNYGESLEVEGMDEMVGSEPEGQRLFLNAPVPQPVFAATDRNFPTANMGIPDIVRASEFLKDFGARLSAGDVPAMIVMRLGNDHTAGPRPGDGYPLLESYVADNDLALGQIVDAVSHSGIWNDTAIFVTEDDPQSGVDHVDAHRSILLVISPYVGKGFLSHRHSSMGSIQKTIYQLLGLGPLNLEDALAPDLSDMFATEPNLEPYAALPADPRVFDPARARIARPKTAKEKADLADIDDSQKIRKSFSSKQSSHPANGAAMPKQQ
jgi:YVTN family beta-propeller protein